MIHSPNCLFEPHHTCTSTCRARDHPGCLWVLLPCISRHQRAAKPLNLSSQIVCTIADRWRGSPSMQGPEEHSGGVGGAAGTSSWARAVHREEGGVWMPTGQVGETRVSCLRRVRRRWERRAAPAGLPLFSCTRWLWGRADVGKGAGYFMRRRHLRFYSPHLLEISKGFPSIAARLTSEFDSFFFPSFYLSKVRLFELNVEPLYCNSHRTVGCLVKPFSGIATLFWQLKSRHVLYLSGLSY